MYTLNSEVSIVRTEDQAPASATPSNNLKITLFKPGEFKDPLD